MARLPIPEEGIVLTHFIVSNDVERSRRFYTEVLGGTTVLAGEPSFVALANGWIIINAGGGPTDLVAGGAQDGDAVGRVAQDG